MIWPMHDLSCVVDIQRTRSALNEVRREMIRSKNLNRMFQRQKMNLTVDIQITNIFLTRRTKRSIDTSSSSSSSLTWLRLFNSRPSTWHSANESLYWERPISSSHSKAMREDTTQSVSLFVGLTLHPMKIEMCSIRLSNTQTIQTQLEFLSMQWIPHADLLERSKFPSIERSERVRDLF